MSEMKETNNIGIAIALLKGMRVAIDDLKADKIKRKTFLDYIDNILRFLEDARKENEKLGNLVHLSYEILNEEEKEAGE